MKYKRLICLDTNIFIYYFQQEKKFGPKAKKIFESLVEEKVSAVTSIITQLELLSIKSSEKNIDYLLGLFLETPNLKIENLNSEISIEAARIRREYGFRLPDSIQLATALFAKADVFITNDKKLKSFKELKVELL